MANMITFWIKNGRDGYILDEERLKTIAGMAIAKKRNEIGREKRKWLLSRIKMARRKLKESKWRSYVCI